MNVFEKFGLSQELLKSIKHMNITEPTEIQTLSIPHIMKGKDVIGESATGSGKTLAFGCGVIDHTLPKKGVQALILTPTREIAEQVKDVLRKLAYHKHLNVISVYGGVSITAQIQDLKKAEVVIATPGRLLDHLERRTIDLTRINLLVLDEADRMLDMGFIDDVERIIRACPKKRQTLFFSATVSRVKSLANKHMNNEVIVSAQNMVDPSKLKQVYYNVKKNMKLSLLVHLLKKETSGLVMVFCNTRRNTDFVAKNLKANNIKATPIHGGLTQNKRKNTLKMFNTAKVSVLVCTDVAARGLDINNVSHVYNYDIPKDTKEYVHRIGRTARAGAEGQVVNVLCEYDYDNFSNVMNQYRNFNIEEIKIPFLEKVVAIRTDDSRRQPMRRGQFHSRNRGHRR
ncbi:ATP-dependent RNA helicase [Candidatus Woesearchaeota archaeon B3_Woes]|nr:MAG: ATP-dependent RNA helicase [Candidatus Woesearchaeota archaeon B3_Woes]